MTPVSDTIVVTGVAGFIGSALAERLLPDYHVIGVDDLSKGDEDHIRGLAGPRFQFLQKDVLALNEGDLAAAPGPIVSVVHLAAISALPECQDDPERAYRTNVLGTIHVLELVRRRSIRNVLFGSTSAVYENSAAELLTESTDAHPDLVYPMTKFHCENILGAYSSNYGLPVAIVRFFNAFGPRMDSRRASPPLIAYCIRELCLGHAPVLHSSGEQRRDYVYVDDIVDLLVMLMRATVAGLSITNACTGRAYSVNEIYGEIQRAMGTDRPAVFEPADQYWARYPRLTEGFYTLRPERVAREVDKFALGSNELAANAVGWRPKTAFEDGIARTVEYFQSRSQRR
jgi:UDP-glucose 4-epimerase